MQKGYVYFRTKPMGRAFRPGFTPELTPKQMLELGVFGGKYMTDCRKEFPASWFKRAKLSPDRARASLNYFGVNASQPLAEWRRKGWIHPEDPRGWFQWYCRYYCGRRSQDDLRQMAVGVRVRRHVGAIEKTSDKRSLAISASCSWPTILRSALGSADFDHPNTYRRIEDGGNADSLPTSERLRSVAPSDREFQRRISRILPSKRHTARTADEDGSVETSS